jgi:HK97 family phage portal protein
MGFFDKFRREKRSTEGAVTLEQLLGGNETLTVKIAMQVPAVAYCVEMIASAAAMLPVKLYIRKSDGETEEITDDPRITLLNGQTGDTMNADNMRRVWVRDFLLTGSAFAYIETRYGMPCALKYIPSGAVGVMSSDTDYIHKHFSYIVTGKEIFPHQMLKILRNSDGFGRGRGIVGESPLIMDTMYQLLKFQKNQVLKGGNKRGFLKSDAPVRKEVKDDIEEKWRQLNSNDDSAERIMFLNGNIDFKEMSSTAVEMQLNENVQTNDAEIMRLFGTADGILSPETVKNAVMPVLDVFEAAFDSDLLLESEKADHYFAFDTKELTRGDISTRYSAYATALQNNFMQLDEVRALEDLPPLGFNYITLGLQNVLVNPKTGKVYTPNTNASANMNQLDNIVGNGEDRAEPIQGEGGYLQDPSTGRMMGRVGSGGSANVSGKPLDKAAKSGIIKSTDKSGKEYEVKYNSLSEDAFKKDFDEAKNTVSADKAWRVDDTYTADDYKRMKCKCFVTEGGSCVAVKPDGDIISVCKNFNSTVQETGSDLIKIAVANGGTKLDSFSGNYGFYAKCGFEPVSWTPFDENYAPKGWRKGIDDPEDVIFFKYVGKPVDHSKAALSKFLQNTPSSKSYDDAEAERDGKL